MDRTLPRLRPAEMSRAQRALHETILASRQGATGSPSLTDDEGRLEGPFGAFLLQPRLGHALEALGVAIRQEGGLPARIREVAILVVAAHEDASFERYVHEPIGHRLGLSETQLQAIRAGRFSRLGALDATVAGATQELLDAGDLTDDTFERLRASLGDTGVFELTTLVGYYLTLALQLRVFRVPTPGPRTP